MKFGIVCEVEGKTHLENGATIQHGRLTYIFYVTDLVEGRLKQIRIISEVDDPEKYFYDRSPVRPDGSLTVDKGYEEHIYRNLVEEMQRLESVLALAGNIKRVYWEKATFEYYPETTEEHARINILPPFFFIHEMPVDDPVLIASAALVGLVQHTSTFKPLVVPMSFFRETKSEYSAGRYINSFFNSYFIIEGLFGNGKWRKEAIVKELTNSKIFSSFVQDLLNETSSNSDRAEGMTKDQLESELKAINLPYTVDGLIKLIVETRGKLHHFSIESTQAQGTPFNHLDYKRIALIGLVLAGNALTHYLDEEFKGDKSTS